MVIDKGSPLGKAGIIFHYADANYLLCTEIMEQIEKKPFYDVLREKLKWNQLQLNNTWFPTLEEKPEKSKPMAHQYWNSKKWDSHKHDISWDLYGGGGIASTTRDMAIFTQALFNHQIIVTDSIQNLLYTNFKIKETASYPYYLGISQNDYMGYTSFGHGGFWGTVVRYFPAFNATIAISIQDRDFGKLRKNVFDGVIQLLDELENQQKINKKIKTYVDNT